MNAINQLFGKSCDLELQLDTEPNRKTVVVKSGLPGVRAFVFSDGEDVCGIAKVHVKPGKKLEHQGIKDRLDDVSPYSDQSLQSLPSKR